MNGNRYIEISEAKKRAINMLQNNRSAEALQIISDICKRSPQDAEALLIQAVARSQTGDLERAEQHCRQVTHIAPGNPAGFVTLGDILQARSKLRDAMTAYKQALHIQPDIPHALNNLGALLRMTGKPDEAEQHFRHALALSPNNPLVLTNLGLVEKDRNNLTGAAELHKQALLCKPDYADGHLNLANTLQLQGLIKEAKAHYRKAIEYNPHAVLAFHGLGQLMASQGETEEALSLLERARALQPGFADISASIAEIHEKQGNSEKALEVITPYIASQETTPGVSLCFAKLAPDLNRQADAIKLLLQQLEKPALPSSIKKSIFFALGDLFDSTGEYNQAFEYYQQGNDGIPAPDNDIIKANQIRLLINTFPDETDSHVTRSSNMSDKPVFIVGMPRSGTTLIEQILSSHPAITGAGEVPYLGDILNSFPERFGRSKTYPDCVAELSSSDLDSLASDYLDKLLKHAPDAARITDKMPHNFLHIGIIDRLFPNSRIIHCIRDPIDTCLSIYFHNFSTNHPYTRDLRKLGDYYRAYRELMEHWPKVTQIPVLNIYYEQLVAEQETTSRKIIEFCGVDWNEKCLRFHESGRVVNTPSYSQVRRPLYSKSVNRWRHYEEHLLPLKQALE